MSEQDKKTAGKKTTQEVQAGETQAREKVSRENASGKAQTCEMLGTHKEYKIKNIYVRQGLTFFIVGAALILTYYFVNNIASLGAGFDKVNKVLRPFYIGIIMAYLVCPIYNAVTRGIYRLTKKVSKKPGHAMVFSRVIATIASLLVIIVVIAGMIILVVPDMVDNIFMIVPKLEPAFDAATAWIQGHIDNHPEIVELLSGRLDNISDTIINWAKTNLLPQASKLLANITSGAVSTIGTMIDVIIAFVLCVYLLNGKEVFLAQSKKLILATCKEERADNLFELGQVIHNSFGGFINGRILDSLIIGVLCFILMTILKIPAAPLVSVIVGVTNVIPFFGPFIGAIPSVLLLLMISPLGCLKFIIMIIVLQQFDGNILGPKILEKATKLSSFWVVFSIIVAGGFFGFAGMVLGVPIFAVIYVYVGKAVDKRLKKRGLETDVFAYEDYSKYTSDPKEIVRSKRKAREEAHIKEKAEKEKMARAMDQVKDENTAQIKNGDTDQTKGKNDDK